jgi:hypothetical protein
MMATLDTDSFRAILADVKYPSFNFLVMDGPQSSRPICKWLRPRPAT